MNYLGLSTSYFSARGFSIFESVKRAADLGFKLIELGANHDFEEKGGETLKKIRHQFPEVSFTQHCYFPPLFAEPFLANAAEGLTKENKEILENIFAAAGILKAKIFSFHCGTLASCSYEGIDEEFPGFKKFVPLASIPRKLALRNFKDFLEFVLNLAEKIGVKVALENINENPLFFTPKDFAKILGEFPPLGFLFDYGHALLKIPHPEQFFKLPKIYEIHLHDVDKNGLDHRILGKGTRVDLENLFSQIKKIDPLPFLILEHAADVTEEEILEEKKLVEKYLGEC